MRPSSAGDPDLVSRLGYAVGVGAAMLALAGVPLRFVFQEQSAVLVYALSFLAGALLGGVLWRPRKARS